MKKPKPSRDLFAGFNRTNRNKVGLTLISSHFFLQSISFDTSTADTTYTINSVPTQTFEYMTTGDKTRLKKVYDSVVSEENGYDSQSRISQYKMTFANRTSYPFTTDYTYDTAHRLTQIEYPAQYGMTGDPRKTVAPSYDVASRLTQLDVNGGVQLSNVSYNTSSQVTALTTASSTTARVEEYAYDSQTGLLTGQTVKNTAGTTTYLDLGYTYSRGNSYGTGSSGKTGQLTKIVDNLDHNRDKLYEFDALGRMMNAKGGLAAGASGVTANWTQSYSYDRYGNKTGMTASGVDQNSASIAADGLASVTASTSSNRITTSGWEYDLAGNLIRGQDASGTWQKFEYDAAGRLKKVKDDSNNVLETYTYGAGREKLMVETSSQRTYFVWGGQSMIAEYTEVGSSTTPSYSKNYVYAGSRLLATYTPTSTTKEARHTHHPDRLGTQLVTTGASSSYRQTTFPFGTTISAETTGNSNQVFTSYDRSTTTGLDYAVNRTYSKGQSRFTQVDPIGMASANIGNPQSNNLYAYVQNMPTDFVDPSGLLRIQQCTRQWRTDASGNINYSSWQCTTIYDDGVDGGGSGGSPSFVNASMRESAYERCMRRAVTTYVDTILPVIGSYLSAIGETLSDPKLTIGIGLAALGLAGGNPYAVMAGAISVASTDITRHPRAFYRLVRDGTRAALRYNSDAAKCDSLRTERREPPPRLG